MGRDSVGEAGSRTRWLAPDFSIRDPRRSAHRGGGPQRWCRSPLAADRVPADPRAAPGSASRGAIRGQKPAGVRGVQRRRLCVAHGGAEGAGAARWVSRVSRALCVANNTRVYELWHPCPSQAGLSGTPPPSIVYASSSSVYGTNTKVPFSESDVTDTPASLYAVRTPFVSLAAFCESCTRLFSLCGLSARAHRPRKRRTSFSRTRAQPFREGVLSIFRY